MLGRNWITNTTPVSYYFVEEINKHRINEVSGDEEENVIDDI